MVGFSEVLGVFSSTFVDITCTHVEFAFDSIKPGIRGTPYYSSPLPISIYNQVTGGVMRIVRCYTAYPSHHANVKFLLEEQA